MERKIKRKPPRLDVIFQRHDAPLYFVTFNTHGRRPLLANEEIQGAFEDYCRRGAAFGIAVGRYMLMPDHVHLFVQFGAGSEVTLSRWIKGMKRHLDTMFLSLGFEPMQIPGQKLRSFWQPGFHDRLLRSDESYAGKWEYVCENPVRAGLVATTDEWPFQNEIVLIDRV